MRHGRLGAAAILMAAAIATGQPAPARLESNIPMSLYVVREPWREAQEIGRTPAIRPLDLPAAGEWGILVSSYDFARDRGACARQLGLLAARAGLKAVTISEADDADLAALAGVEGLSSVWVLDGRITDEGLACLTRMQGLRELALSRCRRVTGAAVARLAALPQLRRLSLERCGVVSNELLGRLAEFPALRHLAATADSADPACLPALVRLTKLVSLHLVNWRWLTDAHLASIAQIKGLEELELTGCGEVRGPGLAALAGLPALRAFRAGAATPAGVVRDAWLEQLARVATLRSLYLEDCRGVTNAGLAHLKRLGGLREVALLGLSSEPPMVPAGPDEGAGRVTAEGLDFLADLNDLTSLQIDCDGASLTDGWLERLGRRGSLERLMLRGTEKVTDMGMAHLSALANLRELDLGYSLGDGVTDAGAAIMGKLTRLRKLTLGGDKISGDCMMGLAALKELEELDLSLAAATAANLERLAGLERLRKITFLGRSDFSPEWLTPLSRLPALTGLTVFCAASDSWAQNAPDLKGLQVLNVSIGTAVPAGPDEWLIWTGRQRLLQDVTFAGLTTKADKTLAELGRLGNLRTLSLGAVLADVGPLCKALGGAAGLRGLNLNADIDTPAGGFRELGRLGGLTNLAITGRFALDADGVKAVASLRNLTTLEINAAQDVPEEALLALGGLRQLRELQLSASGVTDKVADVLAGLKQLNVLALAEADKITDAGLQSLARCRGLTSLTINDAPQITDTGLWNLADLKELTTLSLSPCSKLSDVGLIHLIGLNLESLQLAGADNITDAGMAALARSGRLISLDLGGCLRLTDASLAHAAAMPALRQLTLSGCPKLTSAGLPPLAAAPALASVGFVDCDRITVKGCQELSRKAPHLDVAGPEEDQDETTQPAPAPASQPGN